MTSSDHDIMHFKDFQDTVFTINLYPIIETAGVTFSEEMVQKLSLGQWLFIIVA